MPVQRYTIKMNLNQRLEQAGRRILTNLFHLTDRSAIIIPVDSSGERCQLHAENLLLNLYNIESDAAEQHFFSDLSTSRLLKDGPAKFGVYYLNDAVTGESHSIGWYMTIVGTMNTRKKQIL